VSLNLAQPVHIYTHTGKTDKSKKPLCTLG